MLLILSVIFIAANLAYGEQTDRETVIKSCDKNLDGRIDRDEYHVRLTEVYFLIDADKDGNLTISEILAVVRDANPERLKAADIDGNGALSLGELHSAMSDEYEKADINNDGTLTSEEVESMLGAR
jgi:Ca2+-binding EF-hand superfamily protein